MTQSGGRNDVYDTSAAGFSQVWHGVTDQPERRLGVHLPHGIQGFFITFIQSDVKQQTCIIDEAVEPTKMSDGRSNPFPGRLRNGGVKDMGHNPARGPHIAN